MKRGEYNPETYQRNRNKILARQKAYRLENKERLKEQRRKRLAKRRKEKHEPKLLKIIPKRESVVINLKSSLGKEILKLSMKRGEDPGFVVNKILLDYFSKNES